MPNRRQSIAMTPQEVQSYLQEPHTLQVASNGPRGYPHLVAMWYAVLDGAIYFSTYGKSQKVQNLRRDPRITVMVESGVAYNELRGVVIEGQAEVIEGDPDLVARVRRNLTMAPRTAAATSTVQEGSASSKRVIVRVTPARVYSWDHRELG